MLAMQEQDWLSFKPFILRKKRVLDCDLGGLNQAYSYEDIKV